MHPTHSSANSGDCNFSLKAMHILAKKDTHITHKRELPYVHFHLEKTST